MRKATNGVKHMVPMDVIERLPEELHDPLAVFKSRSHADSLVVLTEHRDAKGAPVVVALDLRAVGEKYQVNRIASVYGKDGKRPLDGWVKDGMLAYKSDRAERSPVLDGLQLPNRMTGDFGQGKVLTEADVESRFGSQSGSQPTKGAFSKAAPEEERTPFSEPRASMDNLKEVLTKGNEPVLAQAKAWLRGKTEDFRPTALGFLQTRHLLELIESHPALKGTAKLYGRLMQQLNADRHQMMVGAEDAADHPSDMLKKGVAPIADQWRKYKYQKGPMGWIGRENPDAQKLDDLMHDATIHGLDPSKEYERLTVENARGDAIPWTKEAVKQRLNLLREMAMQLGGDPQMREQIRDEKKYLQNLAKREKTREQAWPDLVARYQALPDEAKAIYQNVRDWYRQHSDATEQALIKNIEAYNFPETYRRSLVSRMRLRFEEARRQGVYFPGSGLV